MNYAIVAVIHAMPRLRVRRSFAILHRKTIVPTHTPMSKILYASIAAILLFAMPSAGYGQVPVLGSAADFALFTAVGAFSNDGATVVTGDIGTNVGAFTGFPPGTVIGNIHVADGASAQAATDVAIAFASFNAIICGQVIGTTLGGGQILTADVYCLGAASSLVGELILDAEGDPDAVFIFKIDGALSTATLSSVTLINGASLCNVYWQVNGQFEQGPGSVFRGTVVANGAIILLEGASLYGRAVSQAGEVQLHNNIVTISQQPFAADISAEGAITFCEGGSVVLSGNMGGTWSTGATTSTITVSTSGEFYVTNTNDCGTDTSNVITVTVNPPPICTITGGLSICEGASTELCAPAGAASYLWSTGATTACITVSAGGAYSVTITDANGCSSTCEVTVVENDSPICSITGGLSICEGASTELCAPAGAASYLWSTGATTACITVSEAGVYSVTITDANGCSSTCEVTVVENDAPICTITGGLSICEGASTELCAPAGAASYLWSTGATTACIAVSAGGVYSVTITDANGCSSTCEVTVVENDSPICSITGGLSICEGASTELCAPAGAASYLWSTGATTACITVSEAGVYSVTITDANGCSSTCEVTVVENDAPICTITGGLSICEGASTELCAPAGAASYLWSTGATTACITVSAGGVYSVTITDANGCSSTCEVTVVENDAPICTITGGLSICEGASTELCAPAGAASYLWSTGATTACITVSEAGVYSVTITDANGCSSTCEVTVVENDSPICSITGGLAREQARSATCGSKH
jgi:hypothetical protein